MVCLRQKGGSSQKAGQHGLQMQQQLTRRPTSAVRQSGGESVAVGEVAQAGGVGKTCLHA
eukprot:CAMPEP_0185560114 /NCGR_PEP_ID=MMETSP1381-20130426/56139_1 /TAXON_ID=298111 /ORGANISM="Pavlova sp., Strain CCMP459" /LENGTH=59 /DNA_ID=CAMNT_0028173795 /DNA_START=191 /DNA_END=366 /DNA_ORIENTATION=+